MSDGAHKVKADIEKTFFRASKNDFRASRCWLQLALWASCKINFLYILSSRVRQVCRPYSFSCLSLWLVTLRQDKELLLRNDTLFFSLFTKQ